MVLFSTQHNRSSIVLVCLSFTSIEKCQCVYAGLELGQRIASKFTTHQMAKPQGNN